MSTFTPDRSSWRDPLPGSTLDRRIRQDQLSGEERWLRVKGVIDMAGMPSLSAYIRFVGLTHHDILGMKNKNPNLRTLMRVATALNISMDFLTLKGERNG